MVPLVVLLLWEGLVVGYRVPMGIFPRVTDIFTALVTSWPCCSQDSYVTFVKEVLLGFAIGLSAGYTAGVSIAGEPLPAARLPAVGTAFGAVPIVGLAPVLGRAFGVDWQSKAAVVVIVTFFPVVLNTVQGLTRVDPLRLELLRAYAATPRQVFAALRFPNSLPFVFNALKISVVVVHRQRDRGRVPHPRPAQRPRPAHQPLRPPRRLRRRVRRHPRLQPHLDDSLRRHHCCFERLATSWHPSSRGS